MSAIDRETLLLALRTAVCGSDLVRAAWVGGSDATGRTDALSDIDLQLLTRDEDSDAAFALVEDALRGLSGLDAVLRMPDTPDAPYRQRFYRVSGAPEHLMVDLCVMREDKLAAFLDPSRHGSPAVWLDREGILRWAPDASISAVLAARRALLVEKASLLAHIPAKALARGQLIEATEMWWRLLVAPLVEALRARWCPERQDFGLRYLERDLPPDVYERLQRLLVPDSGMPLQQRISETRAWLHSEIASMG